MPCKTYFPNEISLATHKGQKHKNQGKLYNIGEVKCHYCSQLSLTVYNLRKHCLIHHKQQMEKDWLKCSICNTTFPDNVPLQRHFKLKHKPKNVEAKLYVKCDYCDKKLHKGVTLNMYKHYSSNHTAEISSHWILCAICGVYFPPDKIDLHLKVAHMERNCEKIQCIYCPRQIADEVKYVRHVNAFHLETVSKDWYKCRMCSKFYPTILGLKNHEERHKQAQSLQCPFCAKQSFTNRGLKIHLHRSHYLEARKTSFFCNTCNNIFATEVQRKEHYCIPYQTKEIQCQFCPMVLSNMKTYISHANNTHRIVISKHWFHCNICSKHLPSQTILEKHNCVTHKCAFKCQQSFKKKSDLIIHANKMHLDNLKDSSWIPCPHCQWFCPTKLVLNTHTRNAHQIDSRKFSCNHCEKKFSWEEYLKVHLQLNHSEKLTKKPVRCSVCKIMHDSQKLLKIHRLKEHPITEKFNCDQCTSVFSKNTTLYLHVKMKHSGSLPMKKKNYQCLSCAVNYVAIHDLKNHISVTNHKSQFHKKCQHCGIFLRSNAYITHCNQDHKKNISLNWIKCNMCTFYAPNMFLLNRHSRQSHLDYNASQHQCEFCPLKMNVHQYQSHANNSHRDIIAEAWKKCINCDIHFETEQLLSDHQKTTACHNYIPCDLCLLKFKHKSLLIAHTNKAHKDDIATKWLECMICHNYSQDKILLEKHIQSVHYPAFRINCCQFCSKTFSSYPKYIAHGNKIHKKDVIEKWISCQDCSMLVPSNNLLKEHQARVHRKTNSYNLNEIQCLHCGELIDKSLKLSHLNMKHRKLILKHWPNCDKCYWFFPNIRVLAHHQRKNRNELLNSTDYRQCQLNSQMNFQNDSPTSKDVAISHKEEVSRESYLCSYCSIFYPSLSTLEDHKR